MKLPVKIYRKKKKKKNTLNFLNEKITPTFYLKNTPDSIMKYFTLKFYFRKVTPYSEKISRNYTKYQNFCTKSNFFFTRPEKFCTLH